MAVGQKKCPKCGKMVGPRSLTCKHCGHQFNGKAPVKAKVNSKPAPRPQPQAQFEQVAQTLVDIRLACKKVGGPEKALELVNTVEALAEQCGGFAELKKAIGVAQTL